MGHSVCACLKCVASVLTLLVNLFTFRQSKFADFVFGFLGLTIYFDFFILFQISLFSFSPFCGISFVMNLVLFWDNCKELKLAWGPDFCRPLCIQDNCKEYILLPTVVFGIPFFVCFVKNWLMKMLLETSSSFCFHTSWY